MERQHILVDARKRIDNHGLGIDSTTYEVEVEMLIGIEASKE
jgi:hypothetical protein